jgi:hypothetical protein
VRYGETTTTYTIPSTSNRLQALSGTPEQSFTYDAKGRLVAESDATGSVQREYIWLHATPVAIVE